ncbi:tripartite motif-containing protein 42-like isoform X2 [Rhopilema esculentum]|uniref:tripartite motif-containing protein 42-like isoform X2 n=1 Tax=Rhopilema esculentum TaxID=499914 RepID=UPI0031D63C27
MVSGEGNNLSMANIEEIITCGICLERMLNPRMLPCQHSFCLNCLASIFATKYIEKKTDGHDVKVVFPDFLTENGTGKGITGFIMKCPTCNGETQCSLPFHSTVPKSLVVTQLLHTASPLQDDNKQLKCDFCQDLKTSLYECCECGKVICEKCFNSAQGKACKEGSHFVFKRQNDLSLCLNHSIELRYHCNACNSPLCCDCFIENHGQHDVVKISRAEHQMQKKLDTCKSISDGNISDLEGLQKKLQDYKERIDGVAKDTMERLKQQELAVHGIVTDLFKDKQTDILDQVLSLKSEADILLSKIKVEDNMKIRDKLDDLYSVLKEKPLSVIRHGERVSTVSSCCNEQQKIIFNLECQVGQLRKEISHDFEGICKEIGEFLCSVKEKNDFSNDVYKKKLHESHVLKEFFSNQSITTRSCSTLHVSNLDSSKEMPLNKVQEERNEIKVPDNERQEGACAVNWESPPRADPVGLTRQYKSASDMRHISTNGTTLYQTPGSSTSHGAGPIPSTAASFQNLSISNPRFFKTKGHSTSAESGISGNPAAFNPSGPRPNSMQANWNLEQSIYVPPPMRAESAASAYGSPRPVRDISSKKELKIIRITDPKQGGKDVTHEILRAKK